MATFDPTVQPTQAPNYQNSTQGTDRASLQPLASVPNLDARYFRPHYTADTSAGDALKSVGNLGEVALRLTDNVIKADADATLTKGINDIRDSFGVAQAADLSNGIAPAVGAAGSEGTSLAGTDPNASQPLALNRLGNRVEGLTESYRQGNLSNSAYYAKLESFVRQTKQQFPGYSNEIDQMVSQKVGTTPANALRASLLQDVTQLQAKLQGQQTAQQKWEQQNAQYIYTAYPNYDQLKAEGRAPDFATLQGVVGRYQARDYGWQARSAELAATKATDAAIGNKASDLATQRVNEIASTLSVSMTNGMGLSTPADFDKLLADINSGKRAPPTPEEKQQITAAFAQMQAQYRNQAAQFFNSPLAQGSTETMSSKINDNARVQQIIANGETHLETIKNALIDGHFGVLQSQVNFNKATDEAVEGSIIKQAPIVAAIGVYRKKIGDNALMSMVMRSPPLMTSALEGMRQFAQMQTFNGKPLAQTWNTIQSQGVNDGTLNTATIRDAQTAILYPERFPAGSNEQAVKSLFGRGNEILINQMKTGQDQVKFFTTMVGKDVSDKVAKMSTGAQLMYTNWATDAFGSVFEAQAAQANQAAAGYSKTSALTLRYNPEKTQFEYVGGVTTPKIMVQAANSRLSGLNSAIGSMREIFKMKGVDPTQELMYLLPVAGIDPGTPIYSAIQTEAQKEQNAQPKQ